MKIEIVSDGTPVGTKVTNAETGEPVIADRLTMEMSLDNPEAVVVATGISIIRVTKIKGFFDASEDELLRLRDATKALHRAELPERDYEEFVKEWELREARHRHEQDAKRRAKHPPPRIVE